ncbi:Ca2-binding protein [Aureococcus anophagefferens]|nr:Ca2-binding protein [Aureococcus anophagefferens]
MKMLRHLRHLVFGGRTTKRLPKGMLERLPKFEEFMRKAEFLGMSREDVAQLMIVFHDFDVVQQGHIVFFEFLMGIDVERTPFTHHIFAEVLDDDKNGRVDYREFVAAFYAFCTLTKRSLASLAFQCYAQEYPAGLHRTRLELRLEECKLLVDSTFGPRRSAARDATELALTTLLEKNGGGIARDEFLVWAFRNERALYPAFSIQQALIKSCLGAAYWKDLGKKRERRFGTMTWLDIEDAYDRKVLRDAADQGLAEPACLGVRVDAEREAKKDEAGRRRRRRRRPTDDRRAAPPAAVVDGDDHPVPVATAVEGDRGEDLPMSPKAVVVDRRAQRRSKTFPAPQKPAPRQIRVAPAPEPEPEPRKERQLTRSERRRRSTNKDAADRGLLTAMYIHRERPAQGAVGSEWHQEALVETEEKPADPWDPENMKTPPKRKRKPKGSVLKRKRDEVWRATPVAKWKLASPERDALLRASE